MFQQQGFIYRFFLGFAFFLIVQNSTAQFALEPSPVYRPDRLKGVVIGEAALAAVASVGLYYLWYKKFPRSRFHFFNDNKEWLQIDKVGHMTTAYNIAVIQHDLMRWCGVKSNESIIIGAGTALTYMSIIEVLDGFSTHWGFSKGDMLANITGTALFAMQQRFWNEQRATLKFSFHTTPFAKYNPGELGNNWKSQLLKDYNGQTYWLSFNIKSFLGSNSTVKWTNVAVGYGGKGMLAANDNPKDKNGIALPEFKRYRQFYLAPDADFFRIKSNTPLVNNISYLARFIKVPAPTLELSQKKLIFHPLYF
ncbi:MAG: DUF2279 domain-containing protein [Chitinophagaceae bacterium]